MPTLKAQLRDLRAANVSKAEFYEDGGLKRAEFFATVAPAASAASPEPAQPSRAAAPMDLLIEVVMAEGNPVVLDADDFPESDVESTDAETE
jgi:hypothetical protein